MKNNQVVKIFGQHMNIEKSKDFFKEKGFIVVQGKTGLFLAGTKDQFEDIFKAPLSKRGFAKEPQIPDNLQDCQISGIYVPNKPIHFK